MTYLFVNRQAALNKLRADLELTPGNAATHLNKLTQVGYVESRRVLEGVFEVRIFITDKGTAAFRLYIEQLRSFIDRIPRT